MERDYAARRAEVLKDLDGLRVEVDADTRVGTLVLDRPPLNVISYRGREQIRAIIEELDRDDEVAVVVIRGANGVWW
jgi:enoyl-CoA hydratase/carnithine racemase